MITCLAISILFGSIVGYSGPAFEKSRARLREALEQRRTRTRERKEFPVAKVIPIQLPVSVCDVCFLRTCPYHRSSE